MEVLRSQRGTWGVPKISQWGKPLPHLSWGEPRDQGQLTEGGTIVGQPMRSWTQEGHTAAAKGTTPGKVEDRELLWSLPSTYPPTSRQCLPKANVSWKPTERAWEMEPAGSGPSNAESRGGTACAPERGIWGQAGPGPLHCITILKPEKLLSRNLLWCVGPSANTKRMKRTIIVSNSSSNDKMVLRLPIIT